MLASFTIQERFTHPTAAMTELGFELRHFQYKVQQELESWIAVLRLTEYKFPPNLAAPNGYAYRILHLYYHVAKILADTWLNTLSEMACDRHGSDFLDIISDCVETYKILFPSGEKAVRIRHDPELSSPNSISDIGWIAPLFFTAINCRNHRLRHQEIKLLQSKMHREGIWNADLAVQVARQVIEIEEGRFYDYMEQDEFDVHAIPTDRDLAAPTLPENCRLSKIGIILPEDRTGKLLLKALRKRRNCVLETISKVYDLPSRQWKDIAWSTSLNLFAIQARSLDVMNLSPQCPGLCFYKVPKGLRKDVCNVFWSLNVIVRRIERKSVTTESRAILVKKISDPSNPR